MFYNVSKYLFLALIASIPVFRPSIYTSPVAPIPVSDVLFAASAVFFVLAVLRREKPVVFDNAFWFLALFAGCLVLSTIFSIQLSRSIIKLAGHFYLFGLAVLAIEFAEDDGFLRQAVIAWLVGLFITVLAVFAGLVLFVLGLTTQAENYFLFHFGTLPAGGYPRIMALFGNANMLCSYLAVSVPLLFAAIRTGWIGKSIGLVLFSGSVVAVAFTISPGIGGVLLSCGLWFYFSDGPRFSLTIRTTVLVVTVLCSVAFIGAAMVSVDSPNSEADFRVPGVGIVLEPSVRVLTMRSAAQTFLENPIIGNGTGTNAAYVRYLPLSGRWQLLLDAHNMWFSVAAQTGSMGLAAFCFLLFHIFRRCRFRLKGSGETAVFCVAFSCAFAGGFLYQGITGSFEDARHAWLLIGLLIAANGKLAREKQQRGNFKLI